MSIEQNKSNFIKDILWYTLGGILPLLIGFFRVPVFTRYFTASEYGIYGLILITYTILSTFLFSWLSNCIWRFYNKYKNQKKLPVLYSNLFLLYVTFSGIFAMVSITWNLSSKDLLTQKLVLFIFIQLIISNLNNYILIIYRLEEKSALFNIITGLRVVLSFALQYILTFKMGMRIEAIPVSMIIIELLLALFLVFRFLKTEKICLKYISSSSIKELFSYALPGIITNLGLYMLTLSDRYIIAIYENIDKVGIYNQIYNLCQISLMALINVYMSVINPRFFKELESNFSSTSKLTFIYIKSYVLLIAPIITYFSLFAKPITDLLLGKEFRVGFTMIPWIAFSVFCYGLTLFFENRLKLNSKYRPIIIGFILSTLLNLLINFITIPYWGYHWAAISTLISYLVLLVYFVFTDIKINQLKVENLKLLLPALFILLLQSIIYIKIPLLNKTKDSPIASIIIGSLFLISYLLVVSFFNLKDLKKLQRIQSNS